MAQERTAIIESASHDLSKEQRSIASLSKGEALLSSNFAPMAFPLHIPFFDDEIRKQNNTDTSSNERVVKKRFSGIGM